MAIDIGKKISKLKDTIATAKAEKKVAQKRIDEITKELEDKGLTIESLPEAIKKKKEQIETLEKEIIELIEDAEKILTQ